eukprot:GHVP01056505.1.p1 GENE.GHVP01056505.1~~GHVP01056505.1.p1  ORF type:complete len:152 (+),score=20.18 GHVP01056505.1:21-476(+)
MENFFSVLEKNQIPEISRSHLENAGDSKQSGSLTNERNENFRILERSIKKWENLSNLTTSSPAEIFRPLVHNFVSVSDLENSLLQDSLQSGTSKEQIRQRVGIKKILSNIHRSQKRIKRIKSKRFRKIQRESLVKHDRSEQEFHTACLDKT